MGSRMHLRFLRKETRNPPQVKMALEEVGQTEGEAVAVEVEGHETSLVDLERVEEEAEGWNQNRGLEMTQLQRTGATTKCSKIAGLELEVVGGEEARNGQPIASH